MEMRMKVKMSVREPAKNVYMYVHVTTQESPLVQLVPPIHHQRTEKSLSLFLIIIACNCRPTYALGFCFPFWLEKQSGFTSSWFWSGNDCVFDGDRSVIDSVRTHVAVDYNTITKCLRYDYVTNRAYNTIRLRHIIHSCKHLRCT